VGIGEGTVIVVEGPDGAGKTTFIELLKGYTNLEVAPRVVSKDAEAMVDLREWVHENVRAGWQELIFDRHRLISEPIYGPVLREEFEPGFSSLSWFYAMLEKFYACKPVIVYCLPPFDVVWKNVMSDDDNRIFHTNGRALRQIWSAYLNKACTDYALNKHIIIYDYTSDDPMFYVKRIQHFINNRRKQVVINVQ
jgi:hypothetical protein